MISNGSQNNQVRFDPKTLGRLNDMGLDADDVAERIRDLRRYMPCQDDEAHFNEAVISLLTERNEALQETQNRDTVDNSPTDYVTVPRGVLEEEHRLLLGRIQRVRNLLGLQPLLTGKQQRRIAGQEKSRSATNIQYVE